MRLLLLASALVASAEAAGDDCIVSSWGSWGACSKSCASADGSGTHFRKRSVLSPASGDGAACPFAVQAKSCSIHCCAGYERAGDPSQIDTLVQASEILDDGTMVQSVRASIGHYHIPFSHALTVCSARDMGLCSREQLMEAWHAKLEVCACGWVDNGQMYFPMQHATSHCGNAASLHECGASTYKGAVGDVFCCGERPIERECLACGPGRFIAFGTGSCKACPAGRYSATGGRSCDACPTGRAGTAQGATAITSCVICAAGKFADAAAAHCSDCPAGKAHSTPGSQSDACVNCAPGRFSSPERACVDCARGRYQPKPAQSACVSCVAGRANMLERQSASDSCGPCAAGTYATEGANKCMPCPAGTASDTALATMPSACGVCQPGTFAPEGSTSCSLCTPGRYATGGGSSECAECAAGRFQTEHGSQEQCAPCPVGHWCGAIDAVPVACAAGRYRGAPGATLTTACTACAAGSFSDTAGSAACTTCPVGTFQAFEGRTKCAECGSGTAQPLEGRANAHDCEQCVAGKYQPHAALTFCIPCGKGLYQPSLGQTSCLQCAAGRAAAATPADATSAEGACTDCTPGQYSAEPAADACTACAIGRASATAAATSAATCEHCDWGTFADTEGAATCTSCARGKYGEQRGTTQGRGAHCIHCPAAKYQQYDGSTECHFCAAGKYASAPGSAECNACARVDALRYDWSASGATTCFAKKLDCKVSSWSSWGACTKSCTLDGARGMRQRSRAPVQQLPCGLGQRCEEAWGLGAKPCSSFVQHETQFCNDTPCPQNCVPSVHLSPWEQCTRSCGGGLARRTRQIRVPAAHGGTCDIIPQCDQAACTAAGTCERCLAITTPCNAQSCDFKSLPRCHGEHIRCAVKETSVNARSVLQAPKNGGTCSKMWEYGYGDCHHCDTPAECALKGLHKTIVVTHDRKYAHLERQTSMFHCFFEHDMASCFCTCRMHPPCTARQGKLLSNTALVGNRWEGVGARQECCNMCTNNPDCDSFTYAAVAKTCTFYTGSPVYSSAPAAASSAVWSGCQSGDVC